MSEAKSALGGKLLTGPFCVLGVFVCIAAYFVAQRFLLGLGAVSNMSGGYPWGIWIAVDVVVGTGLGCSGFAIAILIYVLNDRSYSPLMRPALMASLFGYTLAGASVILDLGRYWQFYNLMLPWYAQPNSILFEVAVCIGAYVLVLFIEFAPVVLEGAGLDRAMKVIRPAMWVMLALGIFFPLLHQSSMGSLLLVLGSQLSPLWHTSWLPGLYLISAIAMGYGVVVLEATLVSNAFRLPSEHRLLMRLAPIIVILIMIFLVVRIGDILYRGHGALMFAGDTDALLFAIESVLFVASIVLLWSPRVRRSQAGMFLAAALLVTADVLYRINGFLVAYDPGAGWVYFPSVPELMITLGIFSLEIMLYLTFIKKLPVLSGVPAARARQEA